MAMASKTSSTVMGEHFTAGQVAHLAGVSFRQLDRCARPPDTPAASQQRTDFSPA